ncbi:hypothetical protein FOL47_001653 [Perkinsus chesapeaki]|uniref:Vps72/YL1 N-terminal domain-containing protein n=1 Tax=Perkinsus chesapeaki TaxID=330153 RepID=A0A7J6MIG5_PERCH|nr:hypothetical protein FOL47_001653 [Perkinsus chesapeaki]
MDGSDVSSGTEGESSGDEEEITWNVNEREKRIIQKPATSRDDDEFWSSTLHDTWEEDPDDTSISFNSEDEADEQWQDVGESSMSDSDSVDDEDAESGVDEASDDSLKRRRKPNKYVDPELQPKKRKTGVKQRAKKSGEISGPSREETSDNGKSSPQSRGVSTRDTTQAQTVDSNVREADRQHTQAERRNRRGKKVKSKWPSYDELMQEAREVEVWNTGQLTSYIAYEKELQQTGHHQSSAVKARKKARETAPYIRWTSSSSSDGHGAVEVLSFHNGATSSAISPPTVGQVTEPDQTGPWKYREPLTNEKFNTIQEYQSLRQKGKERELSEFRRALEALEAFCPNG